jgi:hypothetical protein
MMYLLGSLALAAALVGLYLLARHRGWQIPSWAYAALAWLGIGLLWVVGRRGRAAAPPAGPPTERVRRTAGDILAEHEAERQAAITAAGASTEREADVTDLLNARNRRRR